MSTDLAIVDQDIKSAYLYKLSIETLQAKRGIVNWLNPSEAAIVLGIPVNGKVPNKLKWLTEQEPIVNHTRSGNETQYWWPELEVVADQISRGEIIIPTKF